jgi:signal transduction histidine kinase
MKYLRIIFKVSVLLGFMPMGFGQSYFDSLLVNLKTIEASPQTIEMDSIYGNNFIEYQYGNLNNANKKVQNEMFLNRFQKSNWKQAPGMVFLIKGMNELYIGHKKIAIYYYEMAYNHFKENKSYNFQYYTTNRIIYVGLQELLFSKNSNPLYRQNILRYLNEIRANTNTKNSVLDRMNLEVNFALFYLTAKDYKKAYYYYDKYLNIVKVDKEKYYYHNLNAVWAKNLCLLYTNHEKEALIAINKLKEICKHPRSDGSHKFLQIMFGIFMGKYYLEQGQYQKTIKEVNLILDYSVKSGNPQFLPVLYENLYLANKAIGNTVEALKNSEILHKLEQENETNIFKEQFALLQIKNETTENKARIKQLENNQLKKENEKQALIKYILIASLLLGCGFIFYNYRKNLQLKAKNSELTTKNKEIEQALFKGQTIERKRVAEELHDNLSAKISGIRMRMEAIKPNFKTEKEEKIYHSSVNALAEVYTDVRLISHNLLPADLETKGLSIAIQHLVEELNTTDKTHFIFKNKIENKRFSSKTEYELFSIILELSNNIMKHSKAVNAEISLQIIDKSLFLNVNDNGVGFPEIDQKTGMGFANLRSRVESISGKLFVKNNNGVNVEVEVPIM